MQSVSFSTLRRVALPGLAVASIATALPISAAFARVLNVGGPGYPTLESAVAAVPSVRRGLKPNEPIEIVLPPGPTRLRAPVTIDAAHGGTDGSRLILRGNRDGTSYISGAVAISARPARAADMAGITLPPGTLLLDLKGLPEVAQLDRRGPGTPPASSIQLFQGGAWLMPSRWPVKGFTTAPAIGTNRDGPTVSVPPAMAAIWRAEPALWAAGQWGADWEYERVPVASLSGAALRLMPLDAKQPVRPTVKYRIENAVSALTPGHVAFVPARRIAFVLPNAGAKRFEATVAGQLLRLDRASHVTISGLRFERSGGDAVRVTNGTDIAIEDGVVRQAAGNGIAVIGGERVAIRRMIVAETGERGVILGGGARVSLTPAHHAFVDGLVSDFGLLSPSYRPGVDIWGVGNIVSGSVIQRGDHAGVLVSGNDHVVADNEIRQVLRDTEDAGAVYMGADWSQRGNRITGNYIHDLGTPGRKTTFLNGVYLDDQNSGTQVIGNLVVGGEFGVTIGGGRDNRVAGNVFAFQTRGGLFFDARGMDKQRPMMPTFVRKLQAMPTTSESWRSHYPALAALTPAQYGVPDGNVVAGNRVIGPVGPPCAGPRIIAGPQPVLHYLRLDANVAVCAAPDRVAGFEKVRRKRVAVLQDRLAALSGQD
ncbi:right-handed parallel beta-helix repeat-containing protein [Sphingomonas prati]|uniref:Right handed beta helix domain-containing protein n=1 Tax=Sphingomonas prati TaxID=1843237 RepID=A0A7W9BSF8_9SPHN|nr:right-handed parallel beta-helix repeat-containing protein [Sphingomonas prati]MBB5729252.1 hypothetical protein [Sphingomonas prati]GGE83949.1 hypothetical protein GCM10011404_15760 [Sphingomonas prati]